MVQEKWYKSKKASTQALALLGKASEEAEFSKREEIYASLRPEMTTEFRSHII